MTTTAARPSALGTPRRWAVFAGGVSALVLGIALSITAGLGVVSWQVLETGLVATSGRGFAVVAVVESLLLLVLAWVWLRQRPWVATAVLAVAGVPIGVLLDALPQPDGLLGQAGMLALGLPLIAVGVAFYLASEMGASAQDSIFVGVYQRYRLRPGRVRLVMDGSLVVVGALLGGQVGVGTIVLTVGVPALIEPALRAGHRLAGTPLPAALDRAGALCDPVPVELIDDHRPG